MWCILRCGNEFGVAFCAIWAWFGSSWTNNAGCVCVVDPCARPPTRVSAWLCCTFVLLPCARACVGWLCYFVCVAHLHLDWDADGMPAYAVRILGCGWDATGCWELTGMMNLIIHRQIPPLTGHESGHGK